MSFKIEQANNNLEIKSSIANPLENVVDNFDPEILDFVMVLNQLGFNTYSSCQGHVTEKSSGYTPYVLSCSQESEEIYKVQPERAEEVFITEYNKMLEMQSKLIAYLDDFYANRVTAMRNRLIVETSFFCRMSIVPYFAIFEKTIDSKENREKLNKIFLKEVHSFTAFLETKI